MATTVYFDLDGTLLTQTTSVAELFAETLPSHATTKNSEFYVDQVIRNRSQGKQNPYEQAFAVVCEEYNIKKDPKGLADKYISKAASGTHIPTSVQRLVASVATQHQAGILTAGDS